MCGIAGIYDFSKRIEFNELKTLSQGLRWRGPDAEGIWSNELNSVGLVHRRLSIIDLNERSNQPMHFTSLCITYNGEVYNFQEIKQTVLETDRDWKTTSDTEVLLKLFAKFGAQAPNLLRGMFAFAIYDNSNKELFLARDHFGMKPLYYSFINNKFVFSSNLSSLVSLLPNQSLDHQSLYSFFRMGHIEEPNTLYKDIHMLPAGHFMTVNSSGIKIHKYFDLNSYESKTEKSFAEIMEDSMNHHLISDEKIALFLSSGLDSTLLATLLSNNKTPNTKALTLSYHHDFKDDEGTAAQNLAEKLHLAHEIKKIGSTDFESNLNNLLTFMDQPSIDGVNTFFICQAAHKQGYKVALSGLGADELFGGYPTFKYMQLYPYLKSTPAAGIKLLQELNGKFNFFNQAKLKELPTSLKSYNHFYYYIRSFMTDEEIQKTLNPDIYFQGKKDFDQSIDGLVQSPEKSIFRLTSDLELNHYMKNQLLRDNDWASMSNSVEIRMPFVDLKMLELQRALSEKTSLKKKNIFKKTFNWLDPNLFKSKKKGFGIPVPEWIKKHTANELASSDLKTWAKFIITKKINDKIIQN